jgi:hypothetical protein
MDQGEKIPKLGGIFKFFFGFSSRRRTLLSCRAIGSFRTAARGPLFCHPAEAESFAGERLPTKLRRLAGV